MVPEKVTFFFSTQGCLVLDVVEINQVHSNNKGFYEM